MKKRIAVIITYFGKWPVWIDLFFYSCSKNEDIDFIFFSDCDIPSEKAPNLHFIPSSFVDYCRVVSEKLKIEYQPQNAYKLCDLRPFLAYIHKELLTDYEFWGYGDVDVIWGNIRKFYTDDLLDRYDVFSTHNDRLSGHLTIIRNNDKYTNLCFSIKGWKEKLCSETHYTLDESDFSRLIFPESAIIGKFYRQVMMKVFDWKTAWEIYYSIFPFLHFVLRTRKRRLYFKEQHTTPILNPDGRLYKQESDTWYYDKGSITNNRLNKEYIYLHFMIYKKNNIKSTYYWSDNYYSIPVGFDFSGKVIINKNGISCV